MSCNEFDLIARYFEQQNVNRNDVIVGIGDDCALLEVPEGCQIAISTDTLAAGTHFLADADPKLVAHKALAANLSDLAAMGADPAWVSLALTMPEADETWLTGFCEGFFSLAEYFNLQLIGGDTTKGPLSITITVQGFVPRGKSLRRSGAKIGDWIYVTGELGDSAAGLALILTPPDKLNSIEKQLVERHYLADPRIVTGITLREFASSAIDISDGLISDLGHILKQSNVAAIINVDNLPLSPELIASHDDLSQAQKIALTSGEEYELCFTVPNHKREQLTVEMQRNGINATCVGQIKPGIGLQLLNNEQKVDWSSLSGYDHFKS
ncbi:thiamine-phosphate kinase [Vibrio sp. SS-MA-C1-2]|uniref:thiamine-phosphate kinase n=1 Tax=Vibrio sp. SS-MA-C1-2 TaxID=2908646 RepID=UPI001F20F5AE|nr:thiamine-phosphate kinase [Vibrio sp. SS-MA-C1-2]UJF18852.1 thiamine-phosphate kinase [Vibrio sp. SS-MA-C1-2]